MSYQVHRYHDISCGHRVYLHEGKCQHLHGHNYRVHFTCTTERLDTVGRVVDFGVLKEKLSMWLETAWDHKFLLWNMDPWLPDLRKMNPEGVVPVPFNPTAENMAMYLVDVVGPLQLRGTGVRLLEVTVEETRKCSATYHWPDRDILCPTCNHALTRVGHRTGRDPIDLWFDWDCPACKHTWSDEQLRNYARG